MSFEDLYNQPIPTVEAATFFHQLKGGMHKAAEWTDPPDMEGALEGTFLVPVEQVLAKLREVIAAKYRLMVAYYTYAQSFRGPWWRAAKIEFHTHAEDEQRGAEYYTKRAVALGGPVHIDPIEPPPASTDPFGILKVLMRAEQEAIAAQRELRQMVGDENPMKIGVEEQLLLDQHHLDETHQLLTQTQEQMLASGCAPTVPMDDELPATVEPGVEEGVTEEETAEDFEEMPPEEKAASMRMMKLSQTLEDVEARTIKKFRGIGARVVRRAEGKKGGKSGAGFGALGGAAAGAIGGASKGVKGALLGAAKGGLAGGAAGAAVGGGVGTIKGHKKGKSFGEGVGNMINESRRGWLANQAGEAKEAADKNAEKIASMRFERALLKLADEAGGVLGDEAGEGISSPTAGGELQPQNYLAAEVAGQQAQEANESAFYRQQLGQAQQSTAAMQQQMADTQMQLDQLQQQADQSSMQIEQAAQEAMAARDDAVNATMEVAKARIGAQKMRQSMLELASQDPQALGEEAMAPQPMVGPDGMPMEPGAEGQVPPEEGGVPPGEGPPAGEPALPPGAAGEDPAQAKMGSALIGAGLGGVAGAAGSMLAGRQAPALRERAQGLEGAQDGSFGQAAALAAAKGASAMADLSARHPVRSAISGGLTGAMSGAIMGPSLVSGVREIANRHIPVAKRHFMGG